MPTFRVTALAAVLVLIASSSTPAADKKDPEKYDGLIVFVPSPMPVVEKMLEVAKVGMGDVVYSLGCGDGRFVAVAAKKYGARGVGIDIDPARVKDTKATLKKYGVEKQVEVRLGNALNVKDLNKATVITLYMFPEFMEKLEPLAKKQLKPGSRVVAHDFSFPTWKEQKKITVKGPDRDHTVFLYVVK